MSYHIFSYFYDKVMDQSVYDDWMAFINKYQPADKNLEILELACGTGQIAVQLAKRGHDVTGFDLSEDMLVLANERMQEENVSFELLQGICVNWQILGTLMSVRAFPTHYVT